MANSYTDTNGVYRSKLGATDVAQLKQLEYGLTAERSVEILDGTSPFRKQKGADFQARHDGL